MGDPPASLTDALIALQARLPHITKDAEATVKTKDGQYTYSYANLASIHDAVFPLLADYGLAWICRPTFIGDGNERVFVLAYTLRHAASGEEENGDYPLPVNATAQQIGSAITYARRYCLCAVLGIAPAEDDDDGDAASVPPPTWQPPANPRTRKAERHRGPLPDDQWTTPDPGGESPEDRPGSMNDTQRRRMMALFTRAGITERADRLAYAMSKLDLPELASSNDLSMRQAGELIAHLESEHD